MLPYTAEVLSTLFEQYNRAIWPAQIIGLAIGIALIALAFRPIRGGGRVIGLGLAAAWAWTGWVFHFRTLAPMDFSAPVYGAAFLLQAALLAWAFGIRNAASFRVRPDTAGWTGMGLVAFGLIAYPLIAGFAGDGWTSARLFGVAPGPTAMVTLGLLLLTESRTPLHLTIVPLLWCLIGGVTAWFLGVAEDLLLPPAAIVALYVAVRRNRRRATG